MSDVFNNDSNPPGGDDTALTDAIVKARSQRVQMLSNIIQPFLHGESPDVQGGVLGDLVSLWLAGHRIPEHREQVLQDWLVMLRDLIPQSEAEILRKYPERMKE